MTKAPGDWSIKGLFAGDDSDSSSDEEEEDSVLPLEEQKRNEFSLYSSHCFGIEREIYLKTNKSRGIAHQMWPASELFCRFMEAEHSRLVSSPSSTRVIELGAGVGLCGIFMSVAMGCHSVLVTDLQEAIELIDSNIKTNLTEVSKDDIKPPLLTSQVLCWGVKDHYEQALRTVGWRASASSDEDDDDGELIIVAADCVYWECLYDAFLDALRYFASLGPQVKVIYSHVRRWKKENKFFKMCRKYLHVEVLYESVVMVPHTDNSLNNNIGDKNDDNDSCLEKESAVNSVPSRREITRIYLMTAKQ